MHVESVLRTIAATIAGSIIAVSFAHGAAPMAKVQAPGYYRMMLGAFEITALSDGTAALPVSQLLTRTTPDKVKKALAREHLADPVETSVNAFLVNTGEKLVLIDTGAAGLFGPTLGNLLANLKAAGYQPDQIDEVYITHMHADHAGGLMAGDKLAFPNATVRADKHDSDYWLNAANADSAPNELKDMFKGATASFNPYVAAGKFKPFDGDTELVPGVKAIATRGHTPGHASYLVESKGESLEVLGDLVHVAAVQFPHPRVTIKFDSDSKAAAMQRHKIFSGAAKRGYWVAAAHISFPGIGHIRAHGGHYEWLPANYSVPR